MTLEEVAKGPADPVPLGRPGTGKTVLANQSAFARALAGDSVLYATLLTESHSRMLGNLASLDFFVPSLPGKSIHYG